MTERGNVLIIGVIIGLLIAAGLSIPYYLILQNQGTTPPTQLPVATPKSSPIEDYWQPYKSGRNIDGISISYPPGWTVNYKKEFNLASDYKARHKLEFDFAP